MSRNCSWIKDSYCTCFQQQKESFLPIIIVCPQTNWGFKKKTKIAVKQEPHHTSKNKCSLISIYLNVNTAYVFKILFDFLTKSNTGQLVASTSPVDFLRLTFMNSGLLSSICFFFSISSCFCEMLRNLDSSSLPSTFSALNDFFCSNFSHVFTSSGLPSWIPLCWLNLRSFLNSSCSLEAVRGAVVLLVSGVVGGVVSR